MPVKRREFLHLAAGGVVARTWRSPLMAQTVTSSPFKAIAFDAFPIFDPR
jgi:2-haloacid dehalogenase